MPVYRGSTNTYSLLILLPIFLSWIAVTGAFASCNRDCEDTDCLSPEQRLATADSLWNVNDYRGALEIMKPFDDMDSGNGVDSITLANAYGLLGDLHLVMEEYKGAGKFYSRELMMKDPSTDTVEISNISHKLTVIGCYLSDIDMAHRFREYQRVFSTESEKDRYLALLSDGYIEKTFGARFSAINLMKKAAETIDRADADPLLKATPYSEIIELYLSEHQPDSALIWLQQFENLLSEEKYREMRNELLKQYMQTYLQLGDNSKSREYSHAFFNHSDSVFKISELKEILDHSKINKIDNLNNPSLLTRTIQSWKTLFLSSLVLLSLVALYISLYRRSGPTGGKAEYCSKKNDDIQQSEPISLNESVDYTELFDRIRIIMEKRECFSNPDFNLAMLSESTGANINYVSAAINRCSGRNFRTLLNEYRVKEVCRCLNDHKSYGHYTLRTIAENAGFTSQSVFIRAFRLYTGQTPSSYYRTIKKLFP